MPSSVACFNSRPHEEVDAEDNPFTFWTSVSTHDLTKRSTVTYTYKADSELVSTHDLTKRSTFVLLVSTRCMACFNSRPHEEVDRTDTYRLFFQQCFNSRPHEEVDRRTVVFEKGELEFQLTTSRRGRPRKE